jgi:hypothetical protein
LDKQTKCSEIPNVLIFAAKGPKPEIILIDSVNNDIQIVRNEKYCLVYDKPIPEYSLLWKELTEWWREQNGIGNLKSRELENNLYRRLGKTLESEPENTLFTTYFAHFRKKLGDALYALIPQVYLH